MAGKRRFIAAIILAALCAPGNMLRTPVESGLHTQIALETVVHSAKSGVPGWAVEGVWRYSSSSVSFGGFSALLALSDDRLRAFSDRGVRFTFTEPDRERPGANDRKVARQLVRPGYGNQLWDIESATRDPVSGDYWLGFEYVHAIHRYSVASDPIAVRPLESEVDWTSNTGAEAMVRLTDGRFVIIPESGGEGIVFAQDPTSSLPGAPPSAPARFAFTNPAPGYAVTDMAQLPDGRVLLLMRDVVWGSPPFASLIAIAEPPEAGAVWRPRIALDLEGVVPPENYEGLAVRPGDDATVAVWLIADDNFSVQQRTLVVKLRFDPGQEMRD